MLLLHNICSLNCHLSLNALSANTQVETIKFRALVRNLVMLTLIDSGSSHCVMSGKFLAKLSIKPQSAPPAQVKVVNGNMLLSTQIVENITW